MNTELINELKSQCIVREQRGTTAFNSYMVDRFDTEKFAELIVRECDRYARSVWEHGPLLGRDLLIHFGVEEMSDE
jgi:hypothetical protein